MFIPITEIISKIKLYITNSFFDFEKQKLTTEKIKINSRYDKENFVPILPRNKQGIMTAILKIINILFFILSPQIIWFLYAFC